MHHKRLTIDERCRDVWKLSTTACIQRPKRKAASVIHRKPLTIDKLSRNLVGGNIGGIREPMHRKPLTIDQIRLRKFY